MRLKRKWDERIGMLLWAASAVLLGVSVFLCFSSDLWYDEVFTMGLAGQSFGGLISITARDVHPPLYYVIIKLFLLLSGTSDAGIAVQVAAAKLACVFPFFLCLIYAVTKVRKNFGMFTAGLFSFLILAMPQIADYTVEVRMYGYALFFVTAGMLHAYELTKKDKGYANWIFLTLYLLAACYTHYFACVAACMIYLYLFAAFLAEHRLKKEIRAYLSSGFCCAAGYLPWLISAVALQVGQVKDSYWIQPLSWRTLGGCIKFIFMPSFAAEKLNVVLAVILFFICAGLLGGLFWELRKGKEKEDWSQSVFAAGCIAVLAGIVIFGFLASFLIRPIFVYRYMIPAMGVFWLAFAILLSRLKEKKHFLFPVLLLLLVTGFRNYRAFYGEEMWKRLQMNDAGAVMEQIKEGDIVVFNFDQVQAVVSYYFNNNRTYLWYGEPEDLVREMYPQVYALVDGEFSDEAGIAGMKELLREYGYIWFIGSGNARDEILQKWKNAGMEAEELDSALIERYWFNLYRISIDEGGFQ